MSRIGRKPVQIPEKVKIEATDGLLSVTGPLGTVKYKVPTGVAVKIEGNVAHVQAPKITRESRGYQGLVRALLATMVKGVTKGYERSLEITGVGYKAEPKGADTVIFSLGYTHQITLKLPKGIKAEIDKNQTNIKITGIDKQMVGQIAAQIRSYKPPEPYQGKGIKYTTETIKRKQGKQFGA